MSLNDLPGEILLHILSYFGTEELCLIAKVSERLNVLAKDVLRKTLSYSCDRSSDISHIKKVRCTALLGFTANCLTRFSPSSAQNLKIHFRNWIFFHSEWDKVSFYMLLFCDGKLFLLVISVFMLCYNLHCRFCSFCGQRF